MGAGGGCDAQYLFANDLLGYTDGHIPRHAKTYRDFSAEYARLQEERIAAFTEFANDVATRAFPTADKTVSINADELEHFMERIDA